MIQTPSGLQEWVFKDKIWMRGGRVHLFLLIGWWWGYRTVFLNLVLDLRLSSCTCVGAFVFIEELKDRCQNAMNIHWGGIWTLFYHCTVVCDCFLFLHFLTFLISNCLNLPLETQGSSRRLEPFLHKKEKGTHKGFDTWEDPVGPCLVSRMWA